MGATDKAIQTLFKLATEVKTLWTNASPDSSLGAQELTLLANTSDMLAITHESNSDSPLDAANQTVIIGKVGTGGQANVQAAATLLSRGYSWVTQNVLSIGDGQRVPTYGNSGARTEANNRLVPIAIYGIKLMGGAIRKIKECLTAPRFCIRREVA